jgi:hypothetical protein
VRFMENEVTLKHGFVRIVEDKVTLIHDVLFYFFILPNRFAFLHYTILIFDYPWR